MPDEIDQAQAAEELFLRQSMQKISESQDSLKPKDLIKLGTCLAEYLHTVKWKKTFDHSKKS